VRAVTAGDALTPTCATSIGPHRNVLRGAAHLEAVRAMLTLRTRIPLT